MFPATSVAQTGPRPPTDREIGIIEAVAAGLASKQIGPRLGIEARTVESHLSRMLERYSVESRTELVVLAARMGWITELPTGD
jgi:DNA-binding NarL/FixJ family response regulator